ncbi:uncharacterized protein MAM_02625 [Metarhizium album ARSEF 1941]|uniref:Uncharacterized protein n=1 Tax=Metarhizium album (strain ARSEF 1941) TaxID=1081103 RepID=A0A0B2X242_METAS|nr:uncharacterized protein MAM_02625 [Metarhizium album ARSEF 1941]KHN99772.1 hypothetical protein MAM_02625 [Metarhizium album ARSEF 1941]
MCTTDHYTYVYPDGHKETVRKPALCPSSRHGRPCSQNVVFKHGTRSASHSHAVAPTYMMASGAAYAPPYYGAYPPTPFYTPRICTPTYRSGDDSDRSYHSTSSCCRRRSVYMDPRMESSSSSSRHGQGGRTVLVHNPPTQSTPPPAFTFPRTAPSSPSFANAAPFIVDTSLGGYSSRRPMIVDERPRRNREPAHIHIEVHDDGRKKRHRRRTSSTSSYSSRRSYLGASEEDETRRRRHDAEALRTETRRLAQEDEIRQQRLRDRIARDNAEIARREPVPLPPTLRRSTTAAKATHHVGDREDELLERVQRLDIEEEELRKDRGRAARRDEEDYQRMLPRRRATVGPGSRRARAEYSDGVYRWE